MLSNPFWSNLLKYCRLEEDWYVSPTIHLEDRLVKVFIREGKFMGKAESDLYGNRNLPMKKVGNLQIPSR